VELPRIVIAGTASGVGKTTVAVGLLAALQARGLRVQPFKAGPDYIDPTYHELAAGRACRNLDTWMLPRRAVLGCFGRACRDADLAVIEGVMGLYDGFSSEDESGSTAQLAKWLTAPVVLVLDVQAMARSAGALALGYQRFDPELNLAGYLLNRLAGPAHLGWVRRPVEAATGLPVFGALVRDTALEIPERHLGLIPTAEPGKWLGFVEAARRQVEAHLDLDRILELARSAPPLSDVDDGVEAVIRPSQQRPVRIAVGRDEAFSFYYADNLEMLQMAGAEIIFFSPLHDASLPEVDGLYIGGGFPEVYAAGLAANVPMRRAIHEFGQTGRPVYAECGGLMYLAARIVDLEGAAHEMVGLLPGTSVMSQRLTLGYREVQAMRDTLLLRAGEMVRGHEFHYSEWLDRPADDSWAYQIQSQPEPRAEGFAAGNVLASYVHLHFAARPEMAERFVHACRGNANRSIQNVARP
jgi:cobyrinic acid a,c-diamide synthase